MPPAIQLPYLYCTESDIQSLISVEGETGVLDDTNQGSINSVEQGYLSQAMNWATDRVNFFCLARYAAADLANSWLVNNWCVICAAYWLSTRRGNPPPGSFADLYEDAIKDMEMIRTGLAQVPGTGLRFAAWPSWSNVRVDILYPLRKIRVEVPISEQSPANFPRAVDWAANFMIGEGGG